MRWLTKRRWSVVDLSYISAAVGMADNHVWLGVLLILGGSGVSMWLETKYGKD